MYTANRPTQVCSARQWALRWRRATLRAVLRLFLILGALAYVPKVQAHPVVQVTVN